MRVRCFFLIGALLVILHSCDIDSNSVSSGYIELNAQPLNDTVYIDSVSAKAIINVNLRAIAPNSCWQSLRFIEREINDSTYNYAASGIFADNGQSCAQAIVAVDTVLSVIFAGNKEALTVAPYYTKRLFFNYYSLGYLQRVDTVVVASYKLMPADTLK